MYITVHLHAWASPNTARREHLVAPARARACSLCAAWCALLASPQPRSVVCVAGGVVQFMLEKLGCDRQFAFNSIVSGKVRRSIATYCNMLQRNGKAFLLPPFMPVRVGRWGAPI